MTGRLASKVVVTGGGTGIGRAVAARAAADGAAVVIGGRSQDVGERAATAIARVKLASPHEIALSLVSASGVPAALLDPIRHLIVQIPALPLGLTVQSVTVSLQGVVIRVSGSNASFGP